MTPRARALVAAVLLSAAVPLRADTAAPRVVTVVLKDGRHFEVTRLARHGANIRVQLTNGRVFEIPEEQIVSPALAAIDGPPGATAEPPDFVPMGDRWKNGYPPYPGRSAPTDRFADPYDQSALKGDKPIAGDSLFLVLGGTLETPTELHRLPIGSGVSTANAAEPEFFGDGSQLFATPRASLSLELFKGQAGFRPKSWALKAEGVLDLNVLRLDENNGVDVDVRRGTTRTRHDVALEQAFGEVKLADLSAHYDTVSLRAGIQPFGSDFRGFVFADRNLGARLFGNAGANRWQYNVGYFDLLEKHVNSGLDTFARRGERVAVANVYLQDALAAGYTAAFSVLHASDEGVRHYDENGFLVRPARIGSVRPHAVRTTYLGWSGDGHLGGLNLSHAAYYVFGTDDDNPLAGARNDVGAGFGAFELSKDHDWIRFRLSGLYASGDDDATDGRASGFDAIVDDTHFAGGPFSFWSRSGIPLTQTGVLLKTPDSLLPSLRSSKFQGQQSFVNPGLWLAGVGVDLDLTPKLRVSTNANYLRFDKTGALSLLLFQPGVRKTIGWDLGAGVTYRPLLSENVVVTGGVAGLVAGPAFEDLFSSICRAPGCGATARNLASVFLSVRLVY